MLTPWESSAEVTSERGPGRAGRMTRMERMISMAWRRVGATRFQRVTSMLQSCEEECSSSCLGPSTGQRGRTKKWLWTRDFFAS